MSKYRMYSLVLRQLSPIQKGVQSAHSIVEYANKLNFFCRFVLCLLNLFLFILNKIVQR